MSNNTSTIEITHQRDTLAHQLRQIIQVANSVKAGPIDAAAAERLLSVISVASTKLSIEPSPTPAQAALVRIIPTLGTLRDQLRAWGAAEAANEIDGQIDLAVRAVPAQFITTL